MGELSIRLESGSPPVLSVTGEIDIATVEEFRSALEQAVQANPAAVVDMEGVTFIDLSGLRALLEVAQSRNGQGPLSVVNGARVAWLLELIGIDEDAASMHVGKEA